MVLFISVRAEEKCEIDYIKKENFSSPLGSFQLFLVVSFPEKMIRKCFGGKEKEYRAKKGNFKKKV